MENIGLQDSLLSRFDLLFVLLDVADSDQDEMISDFVVRMHRYRNPKEQDGDVLPMGGNFADKLSTFSAEAENEVSSKFYNFDCLSLINCSLFIEQRNRCLRKVRSTVTREFSSTR